MTDLEVRMKFFETLIRLELATDDMPIVLTCMVEVGVAMALDQFGVSNECFISPKTAKALKSLK